MSKKKKSLRHKRSQKQTGKISATVQASIFNGPRKKRKVGPPDPRLSTHKVRTRWFEARVSWPFREIQQHRLVRERTRVLVTMAAQPGTAQWESVGPGNVGGRMTSVVCDPLNPDQIVAGAAGGGIWKSVDGGKNWRGMWHKQPTLNIGSLAIDPSNPSTIYCGTGEANLSADSYPGVGIFRSIDAGENWQLLAGAEANGIPTRIGTIAVDPFDARHIRLGGVTHEAGNTGIDGMFVSHDAGTTWTRDDIVVAGNYRCHSMLFHPTQPKLLFATLSARGVKSGIWRSVDGGVSWSQLTAGLPAPELMQRTAIAFAPSDPKIMYAISAAPNERVLGVYRSDNGGTSWTNIAGAHFSKEGQMSYGNAIAVHPTDAQRVLCGGVDLHLTKDGGKTWRQVTKWDADRGESNYAHADHHCLLMPVARPGLVYDMNDGGMDASSDGGETWTNRSNGLAVTMFYDVDVGQSNGRVFGGGCQDNGTNLTLNGAADSFQEVSGGDGGWLIIDPASNDHLYTTAQNMFVWRHRGPGPWKVVSPPATKAESDSVWMAFLEIDPKDRKKVVLGGLRVWRTVDDGDTWEGVSEILDGSPISAIDISAADPRFIYVGTENGGFFRSRDGGDTWTPNLSSSTLPGYVITRIYSKPTDRKVVYLVTGNFGTSHAYKSIDGGDSWVDIDRGRLPDVPHHSVAIPAARPQTVFICNDAGVFVSDNEGGDWRNLTRNLPNVQIVDIVYHEADKTLTAATYGRSIWRLKV
jgi:photosystem II stability/assembly factor-like uncharacterized protein